MDQSAPWAPASLRLIRVAWWCLALATGGGCSHSEPFQPGNEGPTTPRDGSLPYQMTLSTDQDLTPSRSADGNWLYAYTERTGVIVNRCLAGLPLAGGDRTRRYCDVTLGIPGVNSSLTWPAELPDGKLAYFRTRGIGLGGPQTSAGLIVGSFVTRDSGRVLRSIPYNSTSGTVRGVTHLNWLNDHTLIFVATQTDYRCNSLVCGGLDTLESGLHIERFDINSPPAAPDILPGTEAASSVQPTSDGTGFYFTLVNDARIYHRTIASGVTDTVYDWGALGVARDVQVADSVLYAVVGGSISQDTSAAAFQIDHGGPLRRVDLRTGVTSVVDVAGRLVRHPSLNAGQHRILAESTDPTVDLWLVVAP